MCPTCNNSSPRIIGGLSQILAQVNTPCTSSLCPTPVDSKCVFYSGGNLTCSGINTKDSIEIALQKIDTLLCASAANYSTYNTYCLSSPTPITTQQQFVEKISQYVCTNRSDYDTFVNTTFPAYQTSVSNQFTAINIPGTTSCSNVGINLGDTLQTILQKFSNSLCNIFTSDLDLSTVNWSQCFTVSPAPTTIVQGFNAVLSQICSIAASGGAALPTFNNTGSCLPAPLTTSDSLVDTVNKIKTRLCESPTYDINALTWNCVAKPSTDTTDLQSSISAILSKLDVLSQNLPSFTSDFAVSATNPINACAGKTVALSSSIADRKVAATATDSTPGTLQDKLTSDTNLAWDFSDPTKAKITLIGSIGGSSDNKVKVDNTDSTPDFLSSKVENSPGNASGIALTFTVDSTNPNHKLQPQITVDPSVLFNFLLQELSEDDTLRATFCAAVAACPSPCTPPSNVSVLYGGTSTTSTTTTSTTTIAPTTTTTSTTTAAPTTTTTTTTTSSTTTTTTTIAGTIFVGAQGTGTAPNGATILSTGTTNTQNPFADVNADWTPFNGSPQFCWVAIPNLGGTATKTKWFVDIINQGNIGGGSDLFAAPTSVTVSGNPYLVYITTSATQFSNVCAMKA